jgi:hypothetical protein
MADKREKSFGSFSSDSASLELLDAIKKLAETGLNKEYLTYDELLFKLRRWWCRYYKRPYKDPLLDTYTFEELAYEYFDLTKEDKPEEQKVSEAVEAEDRDWAEEEAAKEEAEWAAQQLAAAQPPAPPPESDIIVEEAVGLTDDQWASKQLKNPTPDDVDAEDGDISASFEG